MHQNEFSLQKHSIYYERNKNNTLHKSTQYLIFNFDLEFMKKIEFIFSQTNKILTFLENENYIFSKELGKFSKATFYYELQNRTVSFFYKFIYVKINIINGTPRVYLKGSYLEKRNPYEEDKYIKHMDIDLKTIQYSRNFRGMERRIYA